MTATDQDSQETAAKQRRPRGNVIHTMTVHDDLPPLRRRGSVLEEALEKIAETNPPTNKWICIAQYESVTAAAGAANNLRRMHGSTPDVQGWRFATRKLTVQNDDGSEVDHTGLFVQYDKSQVRPAKTAEHKAKLEEWKREQSVKAKAAKAKSVKKSTK